VQSEILKQTILRNFACKHASLVGGLHLHYRDPFAANAPPRRRRTKRVAPPEGPFTLAETAARLGISVKTLRPHIVSGALRYIVLGHGRERPRRMFTLDDINAFLAAQTRSDVPCPSTKTRARRSGSSISSGEVIAFTARPNARTNVKPKK
jgi:Helix-turn-helix domain